MGRLVLHFLHADRNLHNIKAHLFGELVKQRDWLTAIAYVEVDKANFLAFNATI